MTDSSSPVYSYFDDLSTVPVGTTIQYRAILREPDGTRVVSAIRTVNRVAPQPLVDAVSRCRLAAVRDRLPDRLGSGLRSEPPDLRAIEPTGAVAEDLPPSAGTYEYKVAINDSWTVSYGANGGGDNITLTVPAGGADVTFTWDQMSHVASHQVTP